jgi:hypothetical protein
MMVDWVVRALSYVAYLYIAIICVTPGRTFTMLMPMFQYLMAIGLAYGVYVLIRAVRNRREGSVILLCAFLFLHFHHFQRFASVSGALVHLRLVALGRSRPHGGDRPSPGRTISKELPRDRGAF